MTMKKLIEKACVPLKPREELEVDRPEVSLLIIGEHFKSYSISFRLTFVYRRVTHEYRIRTS